MTLDNILEPIKLQQLEFEKCFESMLESEIGIIKDVLSYLSNNKGKRLRPSLMILVASSIVRNQLLPERIYSNAAMIELLHTATLVHDDVVDDSMERRGQPSVNAVWNNKISMLIGDYLFAHAMQPAFRNKDYDFLSILSSTIELMSEGELLAIQQSRNLEFTEDLYYKIIYAKTASLISAACHISATVCTTSDIIKNTFREYGKNVGMAFQIRDDIFDYVSDSTTIGKPVGNDLKEHKLTLPIIFALANVSQTKKEEILNLIKLNNMNEANIFNIIDFTIENGGVDYATQKANEFVNKAISCLDVLEDSNFKISLINFAKFVVSRDK